MPFASLLALLLQWDCVINQKRNSGFGLEFLLETLLIAVMVGVVGARIYYVVFNWKKYMLSPVKIFELRDGGLAIYGGLIAGAMVIFGKCQKKKINPFDFFDYIVPFVAIAQSIGRWGNFFNQEAYGIRTTNIFRMGIQTLEGYKEVHPTFLYESIATFFIFVILRILQKNRKFVGEITYFYLLLYAGARGIIEPLRVDSLWLGNFRISQILSWVIFVVSGIMLLKNFRKQRQKEKNYEKL